MFQTARIITHSITGLVNHKRTLYEYNMDPALLTGVEVSYVLHPQAVTSLALLQKAVGNFPPLINIGT